MAAKQLSFMDITVSIVNWNTKDELADCLKSVLDQRGVDSEVIVVDNASSDGSAEMVARDFPQVQLIESNKNVGFSRAHNQAIRVSQGRYVMLLNPDATMPETDMLSKIVAFGDENPDIAIIGPKIENPDGSLQYSARRFPTIGAGLFRRTPLGKLFPNNRFVRSYILADWSHEDPRDVDWVSGAALVIRKDAIERIGPLDGGYFMYCEDVDWAFRAKEHGLRVCYMPTARVRHRIGSASDKAPIRMIFQFHRSMFRFYRKNYARGWKMIFAPAVFLALSARALFFIAMTRVPIPRKDQESGERLVR